MAARGVFTLAGDQHQLVDQIMSQVRSEIGQGFEHLSIKLIEEIKGLLSSADTSLLTTSSKRRLRQMSSGELQLRAVPSRTDMSTISENASEHCDGYNNTHVLDVSDVVLDVELPQPDRDMQNFPNEGTGQTAPTSTTHHPPSYLRGPTDDFFDEARPSVHRVQSMISEHLSAEVELAEKDRLHRLIDSRLYNNFCIIMISANAIWMGYESDYPEDSESGWQFWVGRSFTIWFIFELSLKVVGLRKDFIFGHDSYWNFVDAICVVSSIPDFFTTSMNLSFIRIVRLARLSRSLRLMRLLRFLRSLREILMIVFHTMESLFWSFVAIIFVAYIFALLFLQLLRTYGGSFSPDTMHNFRDVLSSMKVLVGSITGGVEWYPFAQDFHKQGAYVAEIALYLYIFFMLFGLVNVVIAVFCGKAEEVTQVRSDLRIEKDKEKAVERLNGWMEMFKMIDRPPKGCLTWRQFRKFGHDSDGEHLFQSHGLGSFALKDLWGVMRSYTEAAGGPPGVVDMTGFIMGFMRLSADSHSSNLVLLSSKIESLQVYCRDMIRELKNDMILVRQLHRDLIQRPVGQNRPLSTDEHLGRQELELSIDERQGRKKPPWSSGTLKL